MAALPKSKMNGAKTGSLAIKWPNNLSAEGSTNKRPSRATWPLVSPSGQGELLLEGVRLARSKCNTGRQWCRFEEDDLYKPIVLSHRQKYD